MRQRVVIALALCAEPALVIADEPTTALDVSVQAQIITLLKNLTREHGAAVMLITHDMGVIAETADRVAVMYAGRIAEIGPVDDVVRDPLHPYTAGLDGRDPDARARADRLAQIAGAMPRLTAIPPGCAFTPRCPRVFDRCGPSGRRSWRSAIGARPAGSTTGRPPPRTCADLNGRRSHRRLVEARVSGASSTSPQPWLSRLIAREPRRLLTAVDGVDFAIRSAARRSGSSANPAPANRRWRAWWSGCCEPSAGAGADRGRRSGRGPAIRPRGARSGGGCR